MALLYAGVFGVSVLILFAIVYWQSVGYMQHQLRDAVDEDSSALQATFRDAGAAGLQAAIHDRQGSSRGHRHLYLFMGAHGRILAGGLPKFNPRTGWFRLPPPRRQRHHDEEPHDLLAKGVILSDGGYLLVAQDLFPLEEMRELLFGAFAWGLAAMLILGAAGGFVMSNGLLRRLDMVNRTVDEIIGGDLTRRVPIGGSDDEFDQLARHLNRMLDRLQVLMESMREVSNNIAHDLRTPLGRLRQHLERASMKAATLAEYKTAVEQAIADSDTILETFSALLRIAQVETGSRKARFTDVDLSELLRNILETYEPVADDSGHILVGAVEPGITVKGDKDLLTQMIVNLLENALNYTPSGKEVTLGLTDINAGVIVEVADRGPGIPEDKRDKVFQRFYRLDASRSSRGNGLGLALVKAIADLHGIDVQLLDNQPGLRARLRFPRPAGIPDATG